MNAPTRLSGLTVRLRIETLEDRSPASSLLDLAYLGLSATNELSAGPQLESPFVGIRPGLLAEEGFDRPLTWTVPTDDGKMAGTQSATTAAAQPAERRAGLLEIDAPLEQEAVFALTMSRQPAVAVADTTSSQADQTSKTPPTAKAERSATTLPAFLQGAPPRVEMTWDAQQSMPGIAMSSYTGGSGGRSGGPTTGPLPGGYVIDIQVQEVDFITDTVVKADPGQTPWPTENGLPEWRDADVDGYIDDDRTWDPEYPESYEPIEWAAPTTVVRGTNPVVSAKFKVMGTGNAPQGAKYELNIRGVWQGSALLQPPVTVPATGDYVTYPATPTFSPVNDYVNSVPVAAIDWQFQIQGDLTWRSAGMSYNEMFVTLAAPVGTSYYTVIKTPTVASTYATTIEEVVAKTFDKYRGLQVTQELPPNFIGPPPPLSYYWKDWINPKENAEDLLKFRDGGCRAWTDLFDKMLRQHGEAGGVKKTFTPTGKNESMAIKDWQYQNAAQQPFGQYTNYNDYFLPRYIKLEPDGVTGKSYDFVFTGAKDLPGVPGQNSANPASLFGNHEVVLIGGRYYDPSYGKDFGSPLEWENASVHSYITIVGGPGPALGRIWFRPNVVNNIPEVG